MKKINTVFWSIWVILIIFTASNAFAADNAVPKIGKVKNIEVTCIDYNKMRITWDKAAGADRYRVFVKVGKEWVKIGVALNNYYTHKSSDAFPLEIGKSYTYTICPVLKSGNKYYAGEYDTGGVRCRVRPQTPKLISAVMPKEDRVKITWNKAEGADKYIIYYKRAEHNTWKTLAEVKGSKTEYTHIASEQFPLKDGKTYVYTVRSYSNKGKIRSNRNEKGVSVQFMTARYAINQKVHRKAQEVIGRLTKPTMSKSKKLNACFNWIMASNYRPSLDPNIHKANWEYQCAYDYLSTHTGNCYGFAYGFAALARELGYKPYVIHIPGVHCFVKIDGGYWDNMHGGLRGVYYRPISYTSKQIALF